MRQLKAIDSRSAVPCSALGIPGYPRQLLLTRFPFLPGKDSRCDLNQPGRQFENASSRPNMGVSSAETSHVERIRHRGEGSILNDQLRQELEDLHFCRIFLQMVAVGSDTRSIRDLLSGLCPFTTLHLGFDFALPFHSHQAPASRFFLSLVVRARPAGKRLTYPLRFLHFCLLANPRESQTERF